MTLSNATLVPGLLLILLGALWLINSPAIQAAFKALPRSRPAAAVCFGGGALWFLWIVAHLSEADFGDYRTVLFLVFAAIAVLAFRYAPDFLAVRGLCILVLLAAWHFLHAAYMEYAHPQRLFMVAAVYLALTAAILLAVWPYWLRDFFGWLFARAGRPRALGAVCLAYGLLLAALAFTY